MATGNATTVEVNGIRYRWPGKPVVVVCIDGGDPAYLRQFLADGAIPNIARFMRQGFATIADGTVPSFTCPNNMSIITGTPASKHGISGNYYLDTATGEAVVMTGPELLRGDTILARFAAAGAKVVSITAKDKLRKQLGKNLDLTRGNVSFSSERADKCTLAENGIENVLELVGMPLPDMYSMELSLFVLEAGVKLLERGHRDLMYLSLTDYVQHKYAPAESEARRFYQELDQRFGRLEALGAVVALTADHGMNDKSDAAGKPNVIWLQDILDATVRQGRHHGDLPDHRRVRRPSRRAGRLRARVVPRQDDAASRSSRPSAASRGWSRCWTRRPRAPCTICRTTGRPTWSSSPRPTSASAGPRRPTTCRASRATGCAPTAACPRRRCPSSCPRRSTTSTS